MKRTTVFTILFSAILFIPALAAAQQQTPAPGVPARPVVPGVAPQTGVMPGHPTPMTGQTMPAHPTPMTGQQTPRAPHPAMADPFHGVMFPPDLIMGHARQLNLTEDQKAFMRGEIQKTMINFTELQWKLQDQMDQLHEMMKAQLVNEEQVLAQLNKVLDIEREVKRLHFGLAVRLKNRLLPEQQEQLHKMLMGHHGRMPVPVQPANPIQ